MAVAGITDWEAYFRGGSSVRKSACRRLGAADYYVDGENYIIKMDVPGVKMSDLNITIIDSKQIAIKGIKDGIKSTEKDISYISCERAHGSFTRVFNILDNVPCDISSITAELVNGVLIVSIPVSDYIPPKQVEIPITYGCQSNITLTTIDRGHDASVDPDDPVEPVPRRSSRMRGNIKRSNSVN